MTEIYIDDDTKAIIPYLSIVIGLAKIKVNFQEILNIATELSSISEEDAANFLDFSSKEIYLFYLSFRIMLQHYSAHYSDSDASTLFVYEDFPLDKRLSSETFLDARNKASGVLLNMNELSIMQKVAVLTGFQLISKSGSTNANFGTAIQLQIFRKSAWDYLTDQFYFAKKGLHIRETAQLMVEQWRLKLLNDFLARLNSVNNAATSAYEKLDKTYAELLSVCINKIKVEFDKARKKTIRKAAKNVEIGIAAMVVTACLAPYISFLIGTIAEIGALTGIEALLASLAIDSITSAAIFTGTEGVLKNDYKGFHKKFSQHVAINFSSELTGSLVAFQSPEQVVKGSSKAIKVSAASTAVKNSLQTLFNKGKLHDTVKAALMGGIAGAAAEKLTSEFHNFNANIAISNITKRALEDGLRTGVQSVIISSEKKASLDTYGCLLNALGSGLSSYLANSINFSIQNQSEKIIQQNQVVDAESAQSKSLHSSTAKTYFFEKKNSTDKYPKEAIDKGTNECQLSLLQN